MLADLASRLTRMPDWHLDPQVFNLLCKKFRRPEVDLFATRKSAHLPRFGSWDADHEPEICDTLAVPWSFRLAYIFPPLPLIPRVIEKLRASSGEFLLVTPFWGSQTWFPSLLQLNVTDIARLPFHDRLVVDLTTGDTPPILDRLHLVVGRLSVDSTFLAPFQTNPSPSSPKDGRNRPTNGTKGHGAPLRTSWPPKDFRLIPSL